MSDEELDDASDVEAVEEHAFTADAKSGRLDAAVVAWLPALSRAQVQRLIDAGHVTVDGAPAAKAGVKLKPGAEVVVRVPPAAPLEVLAEAIPLDVLFEDTELIVINKPAGMVVHPAAGHATGTLVNALLHHCADLSGINGVLRPGIVHRLDRDTTGVMVAAKSDRAHVGLTAQFAAKSRGEPGAIERAYLAIAAPPPRMKAGTLRTLYGRHPVNRKKFSSKGGSGKPAVTHWQVVEPLHGAALVRLRLETGRTHQIRVHAADHGWPLLADQMYGTRPTDPRLAAAADALARQALHAAHLTFVHPTTGERLAFDAPPPPDFAAALAALR